MTVAFSPEERASIMLSLPKRASSATVVILNEASEALIVKAHYKSHWTFPGGVIDPGETPLRAACREVQEEVGVALRADDLEFVSVASRHSAYAETYQFVFRAQTPLPDDTPITLQANEIAEYVFISKEEVMTRNRHYGKVIEHWARGIDGYIEQTFGE